MIGLFNPLLDRQTMAVIGGLEISGGWISFLSIMIRFLLSVTAVLTLIATTSFPSVCRGLTRIGVPRALVTQLLFLYRYLFLLVEEGTRVRRARDLRAVGGSSRSLRLAAQIIGGLFIRTMDRAERIYQSMVIRGFDGEMKMMGRLSFGTGDLSFLLGVLAGCIFLRLFPVTRLIGDTLRGWA
jgi:cobalt/nickel transport system permease protein